MTPADSKYALEYFERDLRQSCAFFNSKFDIVIDNYDCILEQANKIILDNISNKDSKIFKEEITEVLEEQDLNLKEPEDYLKCQLNLNDKDTSNLCEDKLDQHSGLEDK
jgi:hypothetical protein